MMRKRGILFVVPWELETAGGVSQVVANLARVAAASDGFTPVVLVDRWKHRSPAVSKHGIHTIRFRIPPPGGPVRPLRTLMGFVWQLPATLWHLAAILRQNNIEVVNVHFPGSAVLHFCLLRALGITRTKLVISVHGLDVSYAAKSRGFERFCWIRLSRCANRIVACSDALAREVFALDAANRVRVTTIHNGVDRSALDAERDLGYAVTELAGQPYILNVATFEHKKGQDVLLDAFRLIEGAFPGLCLVLVGRSGDTLAELKRRVAGYGLSDRVFFYENVPHSRVAAFYERAALFCLPSRAEPFGIVLLEAACYGIPVVASRVGGVGEVVRDGVDARLVEPQDTDALAAALRELLLDEGARARFARAFARRASSEFSWEAAFRKYVAVFDGMDVPSSLSFSTQSDDR
jgi:glycosyltransferase involved in cell wall biosynthesis